MHTKEEEKAYFRQKLRPIIAEVMNNLQAEENRRELYGIIQSRKRNTELLLSK